MPIANPWKSYRQTATLTAPPGQIVLMLYDGILRALHRAQEGFGQKDLAQQNMAVNNNLLSAQEIIRELNQALDLEKGGELAATLRRLYVYFDDKLLESNLMKKQEGIKEVIQHVNVLRDAWDTMLKNPEGSCVPDAEPALALAVA